MGYQFYGYHFLRRNISIYQFLNISYYFWGSQDTFEVRRHEYMIKYGICHIWQWKYSAWHFFPYQRNQRKKSSDLLCLCSVEGSRKDPVKFIKSAIQYIAAAGTLALRLLAIHVLCYSWCCCFTIATLPTTLSETTPV